jgi:hypothetical protein
MKKIYLGLFSIALASVATAQMNNTIVSAKQNRSDNFSVKAKPLAASTKIEGDILWSNNFSNPGDWTFSNAGMAGTPPHTSGDWNIVNTLPTSLSSQAATYGFPATMASTSGGNFALINSDAAGASATQNAFITTAISISLADSLTGNGSSLSTAIYLKFTEIYRHFHDENYIQISNDGGATWTEFEVNPVSQVPVNSNSGNPEMEVVNITSALSGGNWSNNVLIRFKYIGAYDWFWAIDDIQLVEAFTNDAKINTVYQATDITTTEGLDYYRVPVSQTSFPGITFGAEILNNGGANQPNVTLKATGPSYTQSSASSSLPVGAIDSFSVTTPFMIPATVGSSIITITSELGITDGDPANNTKTMTLVRDPFLYGRDDNNRTGGIAQVSSQNDLELSIGNTMEIFDNMTLTGIQIQLLQQATAVGQEINCVIEKYDAATADFIYLGETSYHQITTPELNTLITIPMDGGDIPLNAGDLILVLAHHLNGADEVSFGYAQPTTEGTVLGYTADGNRFQLISPNAIMIRLSEDPSLSVSENKANASVNVYPNPVVGEASIEIKGATASAITVIDLTGKVVYTTNAAEGTSKVSFSTANFAAGVYTVTVATNLGTATKKMVVKN